MISLLDRLIALHAGTSPVVSQTILTLMFVVFGIVFIGIGFGYLAKTKESLLQHRWVQTAAIALAGASIVLVMLPTAFRYYIDPDIEFLSSLSITTIIHGIVGVPAIVTGVIYALGDLPENVKKWMRVTAVLWIASIGLGTYLFLQMMEIV